jgi:hypothetical protein
MFESRLYFLPDKLASNGRPTVKQQYAMRKIVGIICGVADDVTSSDISSIRHFSIMVAWEYKGIEYAMSSDLSGDGSIPVLVHQKVNGKFALTNTSDMLPVVDRMYYHLLGELSKNETVLQF